MMKLPKLIAIVCLTLTIISCGSRQDVVYFQDIDNALLTKSIQNYNPLIKPDDMLTITVSALDYDAVRPFNLPAVSLVDANGQINQAAQQSYLVDYNGNIEFPVLGTLKLSGLNRIQATECEIIACARVADARDGGIVGMDSAAACVGRRAHRFGQVLRDLGPFAHRDGAAGDEDASPECGRGPAGR